MSSFSTFGSFGDGDMGLKTLGRPLKGDNLGFLDFGDRLRRLRGLVVAWGRGGGGRGGNWVTSAMKAASGRASGSAFQQRVIRSR